MTGSKRVADAEEGETGPPTKQHRNDPNADNSSMRKISDDAQAIIDSKVASGVLAEDALDEKVMSLLASKDAGQQSLIMEQFFVRDPAEMKNPSAYLSGVIKSFVNGPRGQPGAPGGPPGAKAGQRTEKVLQSMYRSGKIEKGALDERSLGHLKEESDEVAICALNLFVDNFPDNCRNVSAFFMSQLKVAKRLASGSGGGGGPPGHFSPEWHNGAVPRGGGGNYGPRGDFDGGYNRGMPPRVGGNYGGGGGGNFPGGGGGGGNFPGGGGGGMPPRMGANAVGASAPPGMRDFTQDQIAEGVRVDEFHTCSELAHCVQPYAAKELQKLFDKGIPLVEWMDAGAWRQLACLTSGESIDVIQEISNTIQDPNKQRIRNVNAYFTTVVKNKVPGFLERVRNSESAGGGGGPGGPPPRMGQRMGAAQPETHRIFDHGGGGGPINVKPVQVQEVRTMGGPQYGYGVGGGGGNVAMGGMGGGGGGGSNNMGVMGGMGSDGAVIGRGQPTVQVGMGGGGMSQPQMMGGMSGSIGKPQTVVQVMPAVGGYQSMGGYANQQQPMSQQSMGGPPPQVGSQFNPTYNPASGPYGSAPVQGNSQYTLKSEIAPAATMTTQYQQKPVSQPGPYGLGSQDPPFQGGFQSSGPRAPHNSGGLSQSFPSVPGQPGAYTAQPSQAYNPMQSVNAAPPSGFAVSRPVSGAQAMQKPAGVQDDIKNMVARSNGTLRLEYFDAGVCNSLGKMHPQAARQAMTMIEQTDKSQMNNVPGFIQHTIHSFQHNM